MRYVVLIVASVLMLGSTAFAQEKGAVETVSETSTATEAAPDEAAPEEAAPPEEEKRSVYYKKTQGWLWMEGFVGPSSYDPDQFTALSLSGVPQNAPKLNGASSWHERMRSGLFRRHWALAHRLLLRQATNPR